jgi:hypothetical protein
MKIMGFRRLACMMFFAGIMLVVACGSGQALSTAAWGAGQTCNQTASPSEVPYCSSVGMGVQNVAGSATSACQKDCGLHHQGPGYSTCLNLCTKMFKIQ